MTKHDYHFRKLLDLRNSAGKTRPQVATELEVTEMTIYRAETGASCSTALLRRLAKFYAVKDWRSLLKI